MTERPDAERSRFQRVYGSGPPHLLGLVLCFLVAGYAALRWVDSDSAVRLFVWFAGALIAHDFVLFPLYALADRVLRRTTTSGPRRALRVPVVNHVRIPVLLSGLLFLMWFPLILNKPEPAYRAATGLDTSPYLDRWLLVSAVLLGTSAVLYAVRWVSSPRSGEVANSAIPASKPIEADQPSS